MENQNLDIRNGKSPTQKKSKGCYWGCLTAAIILAIIFAIVMIFDSPNETNHDLKVEKISGLNISHRIITQQIDTMPLKASVDLSIMIEEDLGDITSQMVKTLIDSYFDQIRKMRGLAYYNQATNIYIYVYDQSDSNNIPWIGMLDWVDNERAGFKSGPNYDIKENVIEARKKAGDIRSGLNEEDRKAIWQKRILSDRRARAYADSIIPLSSDLQSLRRNDAIYEKVKTSFDSALYKSYNITAEQLSKISIEAFEKNWPLPE